MTQLWPVALLRAKAACAPGAALHMQFADTPDDPGAPVPSSHIWEAPLPDNLAPGTHEVTVRSTSAWGQVSERTAEFTVRAGKP